MARPPSLLSDDLLRQLIAAGQADIVVGVPTLDNATTVGPVVAAAQHAAAVMGGHQRVLVFNSDGGSTDGTPRVVADAITGAASAVMALHSLRTIHRILAPYHGLPGKQAAVRTIFAVADLLQARAVMVVDPNNTDPSPDVLRALLASVLDDDRDFVATAPDRDPREAPLVTHVVRPLLIGTLGASFDDPVGEEFAASRRFVGSALAQPAWDDGPLRPGIDLWLRVHALTSGGRARQVRIAPRTRGAAARPALREVVQQVVRATWSSLGLAGVQAGAPVAHSPDAVRLASGPTEAPDWALDEFAQVFRDAARDLAPLWREAIAVPLVDMLCQAAAASPLRIDDEAWASVLVEITRTAARHARPDDVAAAFVPIYLGRVASFLDEARPLNAWQVQDRLDTLAALVASQRNRLVEAWAPSRDGGK